MTNWKEWRHITKLDPDKVLSDGAIEEIAASGTDVLMLSGTLDVTPEKLADLYDQVRDSGLPVVVEPADPTGARFEGMDLVFVPTVFNAAHPMFVTGLHKEPDCLGQGCRRSLCGAESCIICGKADACKM